MINDGKMQGGETWVLVMAPSPDSQGPSGSFFNSLALASSFVNQSAGRTRSSPESFPNRKFQEFMKISLSLVQILFKCLRLPWDELGC